jgi:CelD/BcsL family acetyltransferase involved in cellulose biosynthesis
VKPVVLSGTAALDIYGRLCEDAVYAPPQSATWTKSWATSTRPDFIVAALEAGGRPVLALALEIVEQRRFRVARFFGGQHANGNFPAATPGYLNAARPEDIVGLTAAIRRERPDIDLLMLERQLEALDGYRNPLSGMPGTRSPNIALATTLDGGFEALLDRSGGKKRRKKHRYKARKFEDAGEMRRIEAKTAAEVASLLTAFLAMKEEWFRKKGIADAFAPAEIRTFFSSLFTTALDHQPPGFVLHGLEVDQKLRAVTGSSRAGGRIVYDFGAISEDELTQFSPGEFLTYQNIQEACADGATIYDFGVGDEPYKRTWCDIEVQHFDTVVPLTPKGRLLALAGRGAARAKRLIKNNPLLWSIIKRLRERTRGAQSPVQEQP